MLQTVVVFKSLDFLGFPAYRVGDDGSVWSRQSGDWNKLKPREINKYGHSMVLLYGDSGIKKQFSTHRLVLMAFVGPCPKGLECCHNDGNPRNNRVSNLRWDTRKSNAADRSQGGSVQDKHREKMTEYANTIPEESKSGKLAQEKLAERYGDGEVWRDIPGYIGFYQISNKGRLKSLERTRDHEGGIYTIPEKIIKVSEGTKRYFRTAYLYKNKKEKAVGIHRVVLEVFVGKCPENMACCHNDGNPANNRLENLRWDILINSQRDRFLHGTASIGEFNSNSKTTADKVKLARHLWSLGKYNQEQIGDKLGMTRAMVCNIVNNKCWKWC